MMMRLSTMRLLCLCLSLNGLSWASQWQPAPPVVYQQQAQHQQQEEALTSSGTLVQQQDHQTEDLHLEHISLSLRLTCEMNRRLLQGIRSNLMPEHHAEEVASLNSQQHHHNPLLQRGGETTTNTAVHVHPSQPWQPPIRAATSDDDDESLQENLTVFHAKSPRPLSLKTTRRRGAARWGPELLPYLQYLEQDLLNIPPQQRSLVRALSLVYLDRACSVETPRTAGAPPCPFLEPRTVHRLVLASLLVATRAVHNSSRQELKTVCESLGIPPAQLQHMLQVFESALGDAGLYVDPKDLQQWMARWKTKFSKRTLA